MVEITVDPNGTARAIYSDEIAPFLELGEAEVRRASSVEPCERGWQADLAQCGGPMLPPTKLRSEALAAEVDWLRKNWL